MAPKLPAAGPSDHGAAARGPGSVFRSCSLRSRAAWAQAVTVGGYQCVDRSGQPAQGRMNDQATDDSPCSARRDKGSADSVGAAGTLHAGTAVVDPPHRSLDVGSGQAQLLRLERLPRLHPGIGGQAGLDPAGRPDAEPALPVVDQNHTPIFASPSPARPELAAVDSCSGVPGCQFLRSEWDVLELAAVDSCSGVPGCQFREVRR